MADRLPQIKHWLDDLGYQDYRLTTASEDASFRRYFRLHQGEQSWIVMDAPPEKESCEAFVTVAGQLRQAGLSAPQILQQNQAEGFLLLTDFGDDSYLQQLTADNVDSLYADATAALLQMQSRLVADDLPLYDEPLLRQEMELFKAWFLQKLLGIELTADQIDLWEITVDTLVQSALQQPRVFVHRDFHSRNLMKIADHNPGILDFQDAMNGPVTYDLVSLLRDCYIAWPPSRVKQWVEEYLSNAELNELQGVSSAQFLHWFNLMGAQRHLKAIGIFARLKLRDGKPHYIKDIPRTFGYLKLVAGSEQHMASLNTLINTLKLDDRVGSLHG